MKNSFIALCVLSVLSGCATTYHDPNDPNPPTQEAYKKRLDLWLGANFTDYEKGSGKPQMEYAYSDGTEIHTYIYKGMVTDSESHKPVNLVCQVDITTKKGIIDSYKLSGNDCVAYDNAKK